ncbi:hypothetical protein AGMMS49982_23490 [Bacteroidia bacterium]|nr:hypothetical protein AGMMS49982_23490 [Bacteroidia bacterium]
MNTNNLQKNDFSIVFDKVKQYNEVNLLSDDDFLKPEEIIANEDIRNLGQICRELHDNSQGIIIYQTFC